MKISLFFLFLGIFTVKSVFINLYSISVVTIEGNSLSMSEFQGNRILIITLPSVQNPSNDSLLLSIDSLAGAHPASLKILAVPSYEDGFVASNRNELIQWYRSKLRPSIYISDGLYSRKSSGSQQHPLLRWLTHKDENGSMEADSEGPGHKFFVRSDGSLQGVFSHRVRFNSNSISRVLQGE